ncbi:MAG TPA: hypothetical protein VGD01_11855 [Candidatus Elarobacter sp.]
MSALFLAGCGGGAGSFAPRAANSTTSAEAGHQTTSLADGLSSGAIRQVCGPPIRGRARCSAYVLTHPSTGLASGTRSLLKKKTLPEGYGPDDLQDAYNTASAAKTRGGDSVIAIVDAFDNPRAEQDMSVYRAMYGLPACTTANGCFKKVNQAGQSGPLPPAPTGDALPWLVESSLDLDMVSANCPKCRILLVEPDNDVMNNMGEGVNTAARLGATAISNSYVSQESPTDPGPIANDGLLPYYVHPGIAVVAATGDYGYSLNPSAPNAFGGPTGALIPASFPSVVASSGTTLTRDSSPRGWHEQALQQSGSGCSMFEPASPWQKTDPSCVGTYTERSGRVVSFPSRVYGDVAYVGDASTGVAVYDTNNDGWFPNLWGVIGGTSATAPAIAAIYGLAGYGTGHSDDNPFPGKILYKAKNGLNDVTTGFNGWCTPSILCTAGPGYDAPTGNGTPNGISAFQN